MPSNIFQWVLDHRWAIMPESLDVIIDLIGRVEITPETLAQAMHGSSWEKYLDDGKPLIPSALEATDWPILEGSRRVSQAGDVAVLPVVGPLIPRAGAFTSMSGMTSVQSLSYDFNVAMESEEIETIILNIDSPGGEVTGINEFAEMIYAAREKKKILSYVYGLGASAGYWIASAGSKIIMSPTAEVGSIGVVAAYTSYKEAQAKKGIKEIEIVSSQSPNKRPDIESNSGRMQIQQIVDDLANVFINSVAKNRGVTADVVISNYGQGGLFVGDKAIEQGLADRVGSLEGLIQENKSEPQTFNLGGYMNLQELQAQHPGVFQEAKELGKAEGLAELDKKVKAAKAEAAEAENARIQGIESLKAPGMEAIIADNKFDMSKTKESVAALVLEAQEASRKEMAAKVGKDGEELADSLQGVGEHNGSGTSDAGRRSIIKAAQKAMNAGRK